MFLHVVAVSMRFATVWTATNVLDLPTKLTKVNPVTTVPQTLAAFIQIALVGAGISYLLALLAGLLATKDVESPPRPPVDLGMGAHRRYDFHDLLGCGNGHRVERLPLPVRGRLGINRQRGCGIRAFVD